MTRRNVLPLLVLAGAGACATANQAARNIALDGSDPVESELPATKVPVFGYPLEAESGQGPVSGELLAASDTHLWLLSCSPAGPGGVRDTSRQCADAIIRRLPLQELSDVRVLLFPPTRPYAATAVIIGAVSTLTHGVFMVITLPAWLVIGTFAALSESYHYVEFQDWADFAHLRGYARYPQGLPPELEFTVQPSE